jgi:hypothetical protein
MTNVLDSVAVFDDEDIFGAYEFPFYVFPPSLQDLIERISAALQVPSEVIGSLMLPVISAAIGNTIRVSPKEGWTVPIFVWMILIAKTGFGKTPVIDFLKTPITSKQSIANEKYKNECQKYERQVTAPYGNELLMKPLLERFETTNFTIESLGPIFNDNPRGILICKDELASLIEGMNQYKPRGRGDDRQQLNELWNARPWIIDRKSQALFIPNTGASIFGGIHPKIMPKIFSGDSFDDGLLPRFLLLRPQHKPARFSRDTISKGDENQWYDTLQECYQIPLKIGQKGFVEPRILSLDEVAVNVFESFFNSSHEIAPFLSDRLSSFIPKLITYCLKLAGILHVLECLPGGDSGGSGLISERTMGDAISLTKFFAYQASQCVELYEKSKDEFNEQQDSLIKALYQLQTNVKSGKLPLNEIREKYNQIVPEPIQLHSDNRELGSLLKALGLESQKSTGGMYSLIWEPEKISQLFSKMKST